MATLPLLFPNFADFSFEFAFNFILFTLMNKCLNLLVLPLFGKLESNRKLSMSSWWQCRSLTRHP